MPASSPKLSPSVFEDLFLGSPLPCVLFTPKGEVLKANEAFLTLAKRESNTAVGKLLEQICEPLPSDLSALAGTMCPVRFKDHAESSGIMHFSVAKVGAEAEVLCGYFSPAHETSFQQEKLETLGVLAGSVAHDLNNVLTGVLGHVSFLRLSMADGRSITDSVYAVEDGARRAASITQKILDFARGEESAFCPLSLEDLASSSLRFLRTSIPENIKLTLDVRERDVFVLGDRNQLEQVFMNLTLNARDALPKGGEIIVCVDCVAITPENALPELSLEPGFHAVVQVRDTGHGIPPEVIAKIFDPFFTTKAKGGTGLGLAIVSSIVKVHGGKIHVESLPDQGTTFSIFIPRCHGGAKAASSHTQSTLPEGHERILVVDDEEAVRTIVQRSLEHLGYEVVVARNGIEALESFAVDPGSFKLVIIDMIMPNMAGDELFEQLRTIHEEVPVLIASGYSSDKRTRSILERGGLGFIQKPFAVEELAREVRRCLDMVADR